MMAIADYMDEIEFAAENLVTTIWRERNHLQELKAQLASLSKVVEDNYRRAEFIQLNAEDPDDLMMGVGTYWANYFGKDKDLYYKQKDREELEEQVTAHAFSVGSLSGALLQHAKQGISLAHGKPINWPEGRRIGSQPLKDIVL